MNQSKKEVAHAFLAAPRVPFYPLSLMYKRHVFDKVGTFDESYRRAEDIDFVYKLLTQCSVGYLPIATYNYTTLDIGRWARVRHRITTAFDKNRIIRSHINGAQQFYLVIFNGLVQTAKAFIELGTSRKY